MTIPSFACQRFWEAFRSLPRDVFSDERLPYKKPWAAVISRLEAGQQVLPF